MKVARFKLNEERENLFSLYQVVFPELLSKLVGLKISRLEQEAPLEGKKLDIHGWAKEIKQDINVEVQLIPADVRHMEKVKGIIADIEQGIVIWEALSFGRQEYLINEVIKFARKLGKPIDIIFLEINPDVIPILKELTTLYPLEVVPNLSRLSMVREPLSKITVYKGSNVLGERQDNVVRQAHGLRQPNIHEPFRLESTSLSTRLEANQYILKRIRERMLYYIGAYRAKSRMNTNALSFGTGNGNFFEISVRDSYSHVKLRIARKNQDIFNELKLKRAGLENEIGYRLNFKEELSSYLIDVSILSSAKRPRIEVLDEVVEIFKRFVDLFTEYFYQKDNERKVVRA